MSWIVSLDFQDGNGARDITGLVIFKSLEKKTQIHNGLKPVVDTCNFKIGYDSTIINLLLTATKDVFVSIKKDTADFFIGIVRLNFSGNVRYSRVEPFKIECVDMGEYYLKKKISTVAALANYKVSNSSDTTTSIIHYLLIEAGLDSGKILPDDIGVVIDYFVVTDSDTYWTKLEKLLFEMGYVFYFDASGNFKTKDIFPSGVSTTNMLDSSINMLGTLEIKKKQEQFEGISVKWWEHETLFNAVAFNDTTGGDGTNPCNITVAPGAYYPAGAADHPVYSNYRVDDREIVVVLNPDFTSGIKMESGLEVITAINYFTKARLEIKNNDSVDRKITSFQIFGDVVVKGDLNITKVINVTGSTKIKEISTEYITESSGALRLSSGLGLFYRYSDFQYSCKSRDDYNPGDIIEIKDSVSGIDVICRVVTRKENAISEELSYVFEGVSEYAVQVTEDFAEHIQPPPPAPGTGTVTGLPTFTDLDEGYTSISGGTTTPTVPTLLCDSAYKSIILKVDKQTNLRYLKEYQFQVSDDGTNWYSLRLDGVDWKGTLGATTSWPTEQLVHSRIPSDLTDPDDPQPRSLFYRARRVTVQDITSDWSDTVTGITSLVETGDIPANTIIANMIEAGAVTTAKLAAGAVTADKIDAGAVTTDKLEVGIKPVVYEQPLVPETMFIGDSWKNSDTEKFYLPFGGEIVSRKGGAPPSISVFDNVYGGAGPGVIVDGSVYGDIPAGVGWVESPYSAGTTQIDGGLIKTDTLKSHNYIPGVQGSKFDLANGYIEAGDGVFRGDITGARGAFGGIIGRDIPYDHFSGTNRYYYFDTGVEDNAASFSGSMFILVTASSYSIYPQWKRSTTIFAVNYKYDIYTPTNSVSAKDLVGSDTLSGTLVKKDGTFQIEFIKPFSTTSYYSLSGLSLLRPI